MNKSSVQGCAFGPDSFSIHEVSCWCY